MPTTDIYANGLVINKLSKAQYDAIQNPSDTELYLVPDEIDNEPTSGSNNPVKSGGVYSALGNKQDNLVFNTAYNATSNKVATMADISNFVQKSNTSGLIKNDGTIDTNSYLTSHQDISNYIQKSSTSGLIRNDGTIDTTAYTTNTGTITGITMNGASKGTSGVVDLGTVITSHQDISGKADKSDAISSLTLSLDNTNYKITLSGTKCNGTQFTVSNVIDLPLESVVVSGSYNSTSKKVILTLQGGSTVEFSVADLISGLQSEITSSNKLSADLVDDSSATNKFTSTSEKNTWNGKQDALVFNTAYDATTNKVATVSDIPIVYDWAKAASKPSYAVGEISGAVPNTRTVNGKALSANITLSASDVGALSSNTSLFSGSYTDLTDKPNFATVATSGSYSDLSNKPSIPNEQIQSNWSESDSTKVDYIKNKPTLATVATSGSYSDLSNKPSIPAAQIQSDWSQTTTTSLDYIKNKPDITQVNSPAKTITISGVSNTIVVGDTASIGRNNSKIEIGSSGGDDETIRLTTSGSDGGVYVSTDTQKFYYNNKEVATKNDIPTISTDISVDYTSDTKTVSPKAVKTFVENKGYSIVTIRQW